jgi:hypothetical protein
MSRILSLAAAALAVALVVGPARAQTVEQKVEGGQGKVSAAQLVELEGTITAIDAATRDITLKTTQGKELTFMAGEEVKRFDELKVGDDVFIQYYESLALSLSKVEGGVPTASETASEVRAEPSQLPGGIKTRQTTITAKITAVDAAKSTVTLVGPKGRSVTLDVEPKILAKMKVGDLVSAVYTEAVAASVSRAKKP